jgi:hypothetical protein
VPALLEHHRRHVHLYTLARSAARTALWRGRQSLAYVSTDTHLSACVMEQLLFSQRIPFSIVSDGMINDDGLAAFDLLIVPDVEFISANQIDAITRFVQRGGAVLITEKSGQYTDEPRRRAKPAFARLFDRSLRSSSDRVVEAGNVDPHRQFARQTVAGRVARARVGDGRALYLPRLDYVVAPRSFPSAYNVFYDGIDSRYWKPPHSAQEILDAIAWLSPNHRPVIAYGGRELRLDWVRWEDGLLGVMLMRCGELDGPRDVPVALAGQSARPLNARLYRPEDPEPEQLEVQPRAGQFEMLVPQLGRHAVLSYELGT